MLRSEDKAKQANDDLQLVLNALWQFMLDNRFAVWRFYCPINVLTAWCSVAQCSFISQTTVFLLVPFSTPAAWCDQHKAPTNIPHDCAVFPVLSTRYMYCVCRIPVLQ